MVLKFEATDVFTPTGLPTVTYVDRQERELETRLRNALKTPGLITSLSGPSKSGKTVLINRVIPVDDLISISGASIKTPDALWSRVLGWMELPSEVVQRQTNSVSGELGAKASGGAKVPILGGVQAEASGKATAASVTERVSKSVAGIDEVVREIASSDFTVFIDDFHYMPRETQTEVARQIKEAAERGVKICTASVPHRSDDVVRSNPELRGRVQSIDFEYWTNEEICKIATKGFPALGVTLPVDVINRLTSEAFGSPQLMQSMCLQMCYQLGVEETRDVTDRLQVSQLDLNRVLEHTATTTDFSSLLEAFHSGPKLRGQERKQYNFLDGSSGDVYRCVLLAIARNPPALSLRYDEIYSRTRAVCKDGVAPVGSSVNEALSQMHKIAEDIQPLTNVIEWSEDVLDIADPYFLYYLRCSSRLAKLGAKPEGRI